VAGKVTREAKALVGRESELANVRALVGEGGQGVAGALVIRGLAGVGKTALIREATARVPQFTRVVWASCLPLTSLSVPFLPLASAVRHSAGDDEAVGLGAPDAYALTAFDSWLDRACGEQPVVLVVDDLQWADQSSLDALLYVLAGPEDRRLTLLMSVRQGEEGQLLPQWLANVRRLPRTSEFHLGPLDRYGVQEQLTALLGRPPHESLVDELHARAAGNAYLTELLVRGLDPDAESLPEGLPSDLKDAVLQTWRRLTPAAQALTELLAVAGHPQTGAGLGQLAESVDLSGDPVRLLREAVDAGVVDLPDDRYWFRHPLLAEVLEGQLLPEERQRMHSLLARSLSAKVGDQVEPGNDLAVALADHHAGAGNLAEAFRWALTAASSAERSGGAAEALRLLHRAHTLWPELASPPISEVDLLHRVVAAADQCGDPDAGFDAVKRLLDLADPDADPLGVAALLNLGIELQSEMGRGSAALRADWEVRAVQLSQGQPDSEQSAIAVALLAENELWSGLPEGAERAAEAVRRARASGSSKAMALALVARAAARTFAGKGDSLEDALTAEESAAQARDFRTYVRAVSAATNCIDIGCTNPEVSEHSAQGWQRLVALGAPHRYVAWLSAQEAYTRLMSGDWRTCGARLRVALGSPPGPSAECVARLTAALLDIRQGRWEQAEQHLSRALEVHGAPYEFFGYHAIRAELELAKGDDTAAFQAAAAGLDVGLANLTEHVLPLAMRALANQAQSLRDHGQNPEPALVSARGLLERYPEIIRNVGPGPAHAAEVTAMQAMYLAEAARAAQQPHSAMLWERTAEACAVARLAWDEAYARWRAAASALSAGVAPQAAKDLVRQAHALASDLEAAPLLDELEALAREAHISLATPPPRETTGTVLLPTLTKRENEILGLLIAGRTYAQIAAELFLSEKTVSSHISNMLRKTNTSSRIELAQLARRLSVT